MLEDKKRSHITVDSNTLELKHLEFQERESARETQLKLKDLLKFKKGVGIAIKSKETSSKLAI